jgi:hypothetical protein
MNHLQNMIGSFDISKMTTHMNIIKFEHMKHV